jgi:hypothetical protein
MVKSNMI